MLKSHSFYSIALLLGLAGLGGCNRLHRMEAFQTERFDLTAGPAAAEGYPMEIVEGRFPTSDGKSIPFGPEFLEGDWGLAHSGIVSGDGTAPAPDSLEIRWYSYPEDKFYQGRFLLPQKRIYDLLKQGYWNTETEKQETYKTLTTCLLPKGVVVVWLSGQNQVLIGRYQGQEIDFDFKQFNEKANRPLMVAQEQAKLPDTVQAQIRSGTLSSQPWDEYLKTYNWKLEFNQPIKLLHQGVGYFNAEDINYPPTPDLAAYTKTLFEPDAKPVPKNMLLQVDAGFGRKRELLIDSIDEAETLAAFRTLHAARPAAPLVLLVETDERVTKARLFVKNDQQQVELSKTHVDVYTAE
jgi:hypothetical protein